MTFVSRKFTSVSDYINYFTNGKLKLVLTKMKKMKNRFKKSLTQESLQHQLAIWTTIYHEQLTNTTDTDCLICILNTERKLLLIELKEKLNY